MTIGDLLEVAQAGGLSNIFSIGEKRLRIIEEVLSSIILENVDASQSTASPAQVRVDTDATLRSNITSQANLIKRQIRRGRLHSDAIYQEGTVDDWLKAIEYYDLHEVNRVFWRILADSLTVSDELEIILGQPVLEPRETLILLSRFSRKKRTLEDIAGEIGVSRERVRQIAVSLERRIKRNVVQSLTIRIQTALLIAQDMGPELIFDNWAQVLTQSGLLGGWTVPTYQELDPLEVLLAVCTIVDVESLNVPELKLPQNLSLVIEMPGVSAETARILKNFPRDIEKEIRRHANFSGAVNVRWIAERAGFDTNQIRSILRILGYSPVDNDWFAPEVTSTTVSEMGKHDVFHRSVRKLFQYCGPLPVEDVCSAVRHAISRTEYPVPPVNVMHNLLSIYGFVEHGGLYDWDGPSDTDLTDSERVILGCIEKWGPVVHHQQLVQAFLDSDMSFPSLHGTLKRSPLFKKIDNALYKMRGQPISAEDIEGAREAAERTALDLEIEYRSTGEILLRFTLGSLAVASGTIVSAKLPNLIGEWDLSGWNDTIEVTDTEIRRLRNAFEEFGCGIGARVQLIFDTWCRSVSVEKIEEPHAN